MRRTTIDQNRTDERAVLPSDPVARAQGCAENTARPGEERPRRISAQQAEARATAAVAHHFVSVTVACADP